MRKRVFLTVQHPLTFAPRLWGAAQRTYTRTRRWPYWRHPVVRISISVFLLAGILWQVTNRVDLPTGTFSEISATSWLLVGLALFLVPLNYGLEAFKWQLAWRTSDMNEEGLPATIAFSKAYRGVLMGAAMGLLTPNRSGDYIGRLAALPGNSIQKTIATVWATRVMQWLPTFIGGLLALIILLFLGPSGFYATYTKSISIILATTGLALGIGIIFHKKINGYVLKIQKYIPDNTLLDQIIRSAKSSCALVFPSCLRYVIFCIQYTLLLYACTAASTDATHTGYLILPSLVFFAKSFVPSIGLAELGIRETVALGVAYLIGLPELPVLLASLGLYSLNLLLPEISGSILWALPHKESIPS